MLLEREFLFLVSCGYYVELLGQPEDCLEEPGEDRSLLFFGVCVEGLVWALAREDVPVLFLAEHASEFFELEELRGFVPELFPERLLSEPYLHFFAAEALLDAVALDLALEALDDHLEVLLVLVSGSYSNVIPDLVFVLLQLLLELAVLLVDALREVFVVLFRGARARRVLRSAEPAREAARHLVDDLVRGGQVVCVFEPLVEVLDLCGGLLQVIEKLKYLGDPRLHSCPG